MFEVLEEGGSPDVRGKVPHTLSCMVHPLPGCHRGEQLLTLLSVFLSVQTVASQEGEMGDLCAAELHAEQLYGEVSDTPGRAGARTRASFRVGLAHLSTRPPASGGRLFS